MGHIVRSHSFCKIIGVDKRVTTFIKSKTDKNVIANNNFYFRNYKLVENEKTIYEEIEKNSIVIFDGYNFNIGLINRINKKLDLKIIFISDIHKKVPDCEILINHLPYIKKTFFKSKIQKKLIGTDYAILRKPFYEKKNNASNDRVLICLGGYRVSNLILKIFKSLLNYGFDKSKVDIIFNEDIKGIPKNNIHKNIGALKVFKLISKSKLCFITPGNISYEVFSIRRNCIIGSISKTQVIPAKEFDKMKICVNVGKWKDANFDKLDYWINKSSVTAQNQIFFFNKLSSTKLKKELIYLNI
jgi:spore coat polysaccharide biosynthesis predicted glycosyltransferase SpsG